MTAVPVAARGGAGVAALLELLEPPELLELLGGRLEPVDGSESEPERPLLPEEPLLDEPLPDHWPLPVRWTPLLPLPCQPPCRSPPP